MKRNVKAVVAVLAVLCIVTALFSCDISTFKGSRVHNPDGYVLEIQKMNGTDHHEMTLQKGDTLDVSFVSESGDLRMSIMGPDGTEIYQGDGNDIHAFELEARKDGVYAIDVAGKGAVGSICINVKKGVDV